MSCIFFDQLGYSYTREQLERALIVAVVEAEKKALRNFKDHIKSIFLDYDGDIPDFLLNDIYIRHKNEIMYEMKAVFVGEDDILSRVDAAQENPSLIGLMNNEPLPSFFHSGYIYALFWYGLTNEAANPSTIVTINRSHADSIQNALIVAAQELTDSSSSGVSNKKSLWIRSLPFLILMLIIGVVIGTIIYMNR